MRAGVHCIVRRIYAILGTESDYAKLWRRRDRCDLLDAVAADHASIEQCAEVIKLLPRASFVLCSQAL